MKEIKAVLGAPDWAWKKHRTPILAQTGARAVNQPAVTAGTETPTIYPNVAQSHCVPARGLTRYLRQVISFSFWVRW